MRARKLHYLVIPILAFFVIGLSIRLSFPQKNTPSCAAEQAVAAIPRSAVVFLQTDFENSKKSIRGFADESPAEYKRILDCLDSFQSHEATVHRVTSREVDLIDCAHIWYQPSDRVPGAYLT